MISDKVVIRSSAPVCRIAEQTEELSLGNDENCASNSKDSPGSIFRQRARQKESGSPVVAKFATPIKSKTPSHKSTLSQRRQNPLGTVSFYNASSNSKSPAVSIFSPGHAAGRPYVEHQTGEQMPYDEWWMKMRRENMPSSDGKKLDFSAVLEPKAPSRCQLLQKTLEELASDKDRHCRSPSLRGMASRLLVANPSVTVATLRRQIDKLCGPGGGWEEGQGKQELALVYVDLVHAACGGGGAGQGV